MLLDKIWAPLDPVDMAWKELEKIQFESVAAYLVAVVAHNDARGASEMLPTQCVCAFCFCMVFVRRTSSASH